VAKVDGLPVIQNGLGAKRSLGRREMVQRLLAGVGAAWPVLATPHPIHALLEHEALILEADSRMAAADWKPTFLHAQQSESLIALSESIVPGSGKARVNRFIDLLLSVDRRENQAKFAASLTAFENESQKRFGRPLAALTENQKNGLLTFASNEEAAGKSSNEEREDASSITIHDHFENLKAWISGAYYSTEAGMRELGWTGDYVFESYPACNHAEGHG
jgi:hypothetical protein